MVVIQQPNYARQKCFTLLPNRSLSWRGNCWFLASIALIATVICTGFLLIGAWVILPFSGLELLALAASLYYLARRNAQREVITLSENTLTIQRGETSPEEEWCYPRKSATIYIEHGKHRWDTPSIVIRTDTDAVEVGRFLNRRDKIKLVNCLKHAINEVSQEG